MNKALLQGGRPSLSLEQINDMFHKIEPYLMRGLSLGKACSEAEVPKSTVYSLYHQNEEFHRNVERARQYKLVIFSDIILRRLVGIYEKIQAGQENTQDDDRFLMWLGLCDKSLNELFGHGIYHSINKAVPSVKYKHQDNDKNEISDMLEQFRLFQLKNTRYLN